MKTCNREGPSTWLLLLVLAITLLLSVDRGRRAISRAPSAAERAVAFMPAGPAKETPQAPTPTNRIADTAGPAAVSPAPVSRSNSHQRVFRLVLEEGTCRLNAIEEVTGDFRPRRSQVRREAGMICCRLVDGTGTTLAEELLPALDRACVVLDPNLDATNPPVASMLAGLGPQMFQVRFAAALPGAKLEVSRIDQTQPSLVERLLLSTRIHQ